MVGVEKQYGEGPGREEWFPMVILLDVTEEGQEEEQNMTAQYEVSGSAKTSGSSDSTSGSSNGNER